MIDYGTAIRPQPSQAGANFRAMRYAPAGVGALADPILYLAHFVMTGPAFGPHPHAGFSAITYLLRESQTGFRNRDSLGNDEEIAPGGLLWTCAASGILHDEEPLAPGLAAHGLQIFLNLPEPAQDGPPRIFRIAPAAARPVTGDGCAGMLLDGNLCGATQEFRLWDLAFEAGGRLDLPIAGGQGGLVLALDGTAMLAAADEASRPVAAPHAIPFRADPAGGVIALAAAAPARIIVLAGTALDQPVHWHGPFALARASDIPGRVQAYHAGLMGRLDPLPDHETP